ncbi:YcxB-like protein [Paenibacillus sp. OK060]|uniref:YcxB family protein n=1 Tax=Paenibacillus sp. OK060 TaxID=1881034 RepID=UPI0008910068|nr:YcxB family protein [Paenibacillus sp. OK060]SDM29594.1 YcxB-like protein [Paenibacillus sp. OK060]
MKLKFNLEFEDLVDLQKNVVLKSSQHRKYRWIMLFLFTVLLFVTVLRASVSPISLGIILFFIITFPFVFTKLSIYSLIRTLKKQNLSMLVGNNLLFLNDEGIVRSTETANSSFKWNDFKIIRQDADHYFLYVSDLQAVIIPKRALDTEETTREFKYFLEKYLLPISEKSR